MGGFPVVLVFFILNLLPEFPLSGLASPTVQGAAAEQRSEVERLRKLLVERDARISVLRENLQKVLRASVSCLASRGML